MRKRWGKGGGEEELRKRRWAGGEGEEEMGKGRWARGHVTAHLSLLLGKPRQNLGWATPREA